MRSQSLEAWSLTYSGGLNFFNAAWSLYPVQSLVAKCRIASPYLFSKSSAPKIFIASAGKRYFKIHCFKTPLDTSSGGTRADNALKSLYSESSPYSRRIPPYPSSSVSAVLNLIHLALHHAVAPPLPLSSIFHPRALKSKPTSAFLTWVESPTLFRSCLSTMKGPKSSAFWVTVARLFPLPRRHVPDRWLQPSCTGPHEKHLASHNSEREAYMCFLY